MTRAGVGSPGGLAHPQTCSRDARIAKPTPMGGTGGRVDRPSATTMVIGGLPPMAGADSARALLEWIPSLPGVHLGDRSGASALAGLEPFAELIGGRSGPVMFSILGPLTRALEHATRAPAAGQLGSLVARIAESILAVVARISEVAPEAPVVAVVDEPALRRCEHPSHPLSPAVTAPVLDHLGEVVSPVADLGVRVGEGAHLASMVGRGVHVLAVPVSSAATQAPAIAAHVAAGGVVAWGAVPVDQPHGMGTDRLWRRLASAWNDVAAEGVEPAQVREQAFICPSGGLEAFTVSQAHEMVTLADDLGRVARTEVLGPRLDLGA